MTAADPAPRCDVCDRSGCRRRATQLAQDDFEAAASAADPPLPTREYIAGYVPLRDAKEAAAGDCDAHAIPWPARARAAEALLRDVHAWCLKRGAEGGLVARLRDYLEKLP